MNFAQVCIWCAQRWCQSPTCVAEHEAFSWMVCRTCEGRLGAGCGDCVHGVVPEASAAVARRINSTYVVAVVDQDGRQLGVIGRAT